MCIQGFVGKTLREIYDLENLAIDGRIKMYLKKIGWGVWCRLD
jgi:hypothetical protein